MGRSLLNTALNLGLGGEFGDALRRAGTSLEEAVSAERNAALGNGGLGRLAACFLDSIATLDLPGWGYGIRYQYGMFKQLIKDSYQVRGRQHRRRAPLLARETEPSCCDAHAAPPLKKNPSPPPNPHNKQKQKQKTQVEVPDIWLTNGNPWEVKREDVRFEVCFGGSTAPVAGKGGRAKWTPSERVVAVAYDNPIPGYATTTTTNLRLWDARPVQEFDLAAFNAGDYAAAVAAKDSAAAISAVLYPNDATPEGKELRLKQQFFFVSASLQDVIARFKQNVDTTKSKSSWDALPEKAVFQLNDTHPTIAVAELMRLLVDVEGLDWEQAWAITTRCVNYTNHTVMPEALEKWPVAVLAKMLPRHMEIIDVINAGWQRFLADKFSSMKPSEREARVARMSIVQENPWTKGEMLVNMAYLAVVASSAVNGVAAIHSEIVKAEIFDDFYALFPEKFQNKTNGVTPRRWLAWCNPALASLVTSKLGSDKWVSDTYELSGLRKFADDKAFREQWRSVKRQNKAKLAAYLKELTGDDVPLDALFDVQIKRIHEYKRQLMNVLSVIWRYKQLKKMSPEERKKQTPRVVMIGGKAASAYDMAKRIVHLICKVGEKINHDPDTKDLLRLYFLPDYNVSLAELIIPASELSQHISTAGTEASGTSNMKFQMNGCLIIGTMDGANIEIAEETGAENLFIFGFDAEDLARLRKERKDLKTDPRFDEIMRDIETGMFGDKDYFKPLVDSISNMNVGNDWFLVANDFASYLDAQQKVDAAYADQDEWTRKSILYTAGSGKFSSDRTIVEYARDIWGVEPCRPPQ
jgi:starch phosphorylase